MAPRTPAQNKARLLIALVALILPTLSLVPLGGLYLWEKGYLLYWALAAFLVTSGISLWNSWMLRPRIEQAARIGVDSVEQTEAADPDPRWSPTERRAWSDVLAKAAKVDTDKLQSVDAFVTLAAETIEVVARRLHPGRDDSVWQFTVPEAMTITEQVSRRLSRFMHTHVPFGDRLTLAQVLAAYRWRGAIDVAEKAYDVWRLVRLANPATAMTHEARERLSKAMFTWGREHVTRRIAETYIEEVGRAAIDLYGGRLRDASDALEPAQLVEAPATAKPSRFSAGKQAISAAARGTRSLFRARKR